MEKLRMRSRVLAALVALALLLAMQVVPAGAAEPDGPRRGAIKTGADFSERRTNLRETLGAADGERPEPGGVSALALDDDIPGVPVELGSQLPWPVLFEELDAATDPWDVYRVTAYPGDQISFYADPSPLDSSSPTLDIGVALWDSTATHVSWTPYATPPGALTNDPRDGRLLGAGVPVWVCYTVPEDAPATTYYIGVHAFAGSGIVDYQWGVTSRADGNVPGVTLPASGFTDRVDSADDQDDVFAVHLGEGETLEATLTIISGPPAVEISLFGPGTSDVWVDEPDEGPVTASPVAGFSHLVGAGEAGVYYIDVFAGLQGYYTLDWEVTGVNMPGKPMLPSGTTRTFPDGDNVFYQDVRAGETFRVTATDPTGSGLRVRLYSPESFNTSGDGASLVAWDESGQTLKQLAYTVPPGAGGRYYVSFHAASASASNVTWSRKTNPARFAGGGRYDTAVLVSQRDFFDGADTVVIASGEGFADALSAAGLAGAYDAPVLLVPKTTLPSVVRTEIIRLGAKRAIIVGGSSVVSDQVMSAIRGVPGMALVWRIAGPNRYDTSALVADAVFTKCGWADWRGMAAVARGDAFADALALAPLAWAAKMPILLTAPTYLPLPIDARLPGAGPTELPIYSVIFAGGTSAISGSVYSYVDSMVIDPDTGDTIECVRLAGLSRYQTAAKIAAYSADTGLLSFEAVGIATGANFPDALGGGAGIAKSGGVLLMTEPARFTGDTASALATHQAGTHELQVYGGIGAVNTTVFNQIKGLY